MDEVSKLVVENNNSIDSLSLRNASIDDEGVAKIKEAVKNADNLKVSGSVYSFEVTLACKQALIKDISYFHRTQVVHLLLC